MIGWKDIVYGFIFGIVMVLGIVFVKDMMCGFYKMDYSIILGQCVTEGK